MLNIPFKWNAYQDITKTGLKKNSWESLLTAQNCRLAVKPLDCIGRNMTRIRIWGILLAAWRFQNLNFLLDKDLVSNLTILDWRVLQGKHFHKIYISEGATFRLKAANFLPYGTALIVSLLTGAQRLRLVVFRKIWKPYICRSDIMRTYICLFSFKVGKKTFLKRTSL